MGSQSSPRSAPPEPLTGSTPSRASSPSSGAKLTCVRVLGPRSCLCGRGYVRPHSQHLRHTFLSPLGHTGRRLSPSMQPPEASVFRRSCFSGIRSLRTLPSARAQRHFCCVFLSFCLSQLGPRSLWSVFVTRVRVRPDTCHCLSSHGGWPGLSSCSGSFCSRPGRAHCLQAPPHPCSPALRSLGPQHRGTRPSDGAKCVLGAYFRLRTCRPRHTAQNSVQ